MTAEATLIRRLGASMRTPRLRTLAEFAEAEIIVPDGRYAGQRFRLHRHPVAKLLFDELDSDRWSRAFVTGPNQDGKSFLGFVIPLMFLLFERRETVILGVPTQSMVDDKWRVNILPAISASQYRHELPRSGSGSKQGDSVLYSFRNGTHLRFMTAGGDDQSRAAFTAKNLLTTETDGFDKVGSSSREGSKFDQLERRTLAFAGGESRTWAECTVSTEEGRTWQEYQRGTASRICIPCPHCKAYVTPEREHFVGWQDADNELDAAEHAHVVCPACGAQWTNAERVAANQTPVLAHKGQTVDADGTVHGPLPRTDTLGFRWTVTNTVLNPHRLRDTAVREWRARRAADEDAADRNVSQSQWALPTKPDVVDLSQLDYLAVMRRTIRTLPKGVCPAGTEFVTVATDIGKWLCHWVAIAWRPRATPHVIDYDKIEVPSGIMAEGDALLSALRDWREQVVSPGWKLDGSESVLKPLLTFYDGRYLTDVVTKAAQEGGDGHFVTMGFGATQKRQGGYKRDTGAKVVGTGEHYNLIAVPGGRRYLEVNSDEWKSFAHARLNAPTDQPGALTLFESGGGNDHLTFAKHLTSEKKVEEFEPGTGTVTRWVALTRNNHYLDALMLNCVAGHLAGARVIGTEAPPPPPKVDAGASISSSEWISSGKKW